MIERHALQYLKQWKLSKDHKPLIIRGARQVVSFMALLKVKI